MVVSVKQYIQCCKLAVSNELNRQLSAVSISQKMSNYMDKTEKYSLYYWTVIRSPNQEVHSGCLLNLCAVSPFVLQYFKSSAEMFFSATQELWI
jgi:hypothetical protein